MNLKSYYNLDKMKCWFFSNYILILPHDKIQDLTFSPQMPNTKYQKGIYAFDLLFFSDNLLQILYHSFLYCQMKTTKNCAEDNEISDIQRTL